MAQVDIILPTYNRAHCIKRAIDTIINQTFKDWKLIIINDGSVDETREVADLYAKIDKRILALHRTHNSGFPYSLDQGHEVSDAPFVTWISDDNWSEPNHIEELHKSLVENQSHVAQGLYRVHFVDGSTNINNSSGNFIDPTHGNFHGLGATFMYIRDLWNHCHYGQFLQGYEDTSFYFYAVCNGYKFSFVPKVLYNYFLNPKSITSSYNTNQAYFSICQKFYRLYPEHPIWITIKDWFKRHHPNFHLD